MSTEMSSAVKQIRLQEWARQIRDCRSRPQGMTVVEWCRLNGISKTNYYYRLKSVRKACLNQLPRCSGAFLRWECQNLRTGCQAAERMVCNHG